ACTSRAASARRQAILAYAGHITTPGRPCNSLLFDAIRCDSLRSKLTPMKWGQVVSFGCRDLSSSGCTFTCQVHQTYTLRQVGPGLLNLQESRPMKLQLTDRFCQHAKSSEPQTDYFDETMTGLALRVTSHGTKAWTFLY